MRKRLLQLILERAFLHSEEPVFKLASGKMSNYYINCKPVTMDPEGIFLVGNILFEMLKEEDISAAGGLTMGADPLAYALSYTSYLKGQPIKAFVIRKEAKGHGTQRQLEGPVTKGERVFILEDVMTTGNSAMKAVQVARNHGLVVKGVIALVDREEGGREALESEGLKVKAVFTKTELIKEKGR